MTINQAYDKILEIKEPNLAQQDLKLSLLNLKKSLGGRTQIENCKHVENIIEHGHKDGDEQAQAKARLKIKKAKRKGSILWKLKMWFRNF